MRIFKARQRGVALCVCLALLLVLGIAGASAVQTTILEERMARNGSDAQLAFQAAEAALCEAEALLATGVNSTAEFTDWGENGLWTAPPLGEAERWAKPDIWRGATVGSREVAQRLGGVAAQPRFIIEWIGTLPDTVNAHLVEESSSGAQQRVEVFRITVRGVGRSAGARAMLQSTYGVRL